MNSLDRLFKIVQKGSVFAYAVIRIDCFVTLCPCAANQSRQGPAGWAPGLVAVLLHSQPDEDIVFSGSSGGWSCRMILSSELWTAMSPL